MDPRKVGGTYLSGYWGNTYTVLDMTDDGWFRVLWHDGHMKDSESVHCTGWNVRRDRVVSEP